MFHVMKTALALGLAAVLLGGCSVGDSARTSVSGNPLLNQVGDAIGGKIQEFTDEAGKSAESIVAGIERGDIGIGTLGGHPRGFFLRAHAFSIGLSTMEEIRGSYEMAQDADGLAMADIGGDVMFTYDGSGVLTSVTALSPSFSAYKGVKPGMTKKDALDRLGDPSIEGELSFCYDADGKKLDFNTLSGISQMSKISCIITLETDGGFLSEKIARVTVGDLSLMSR